MGLLKKKKNLLILFIIFLISFFFLEAISQKIRKNRVSGNFITPHHTLHHAWKKNITSFHKNPKYEIITNSNGWLETYDIKKKRKKTYIEYLALATLIRKVE